MDRTAADAQHEVVNAAEKPVTDEIAGPEPRSRSRAARWVGGIAAVGVGITLGAVGIAAAADPTPTPTPAPNGQGARPDAHPDGPRGHHPRGPRGGGGPGELGPRGAVHGEFVVPDGTGWRTVAVQRGAVTAVSSTSLSVKSADGYTKTYVITATTLVNAARDGIGSVKTGHQVAVVATGKSGTATAVDVRDLTLLKAGRDMFGPPPGRPGGPPAPGGTPASPSSYDDEGGDTQPA
ncbi:MAG: hypothetical protein QOJ79_1206 [Actinomycetota bacterium]|jgi:hypothetical protein|nr:hypothetical protein [Actinomycetota bacterium]